MIALPVSLAPGVKLCQLLLHETSAQGRFSPLVRPGPPLSLRLTCLRPSGLAGCYRFALCPVLSASSFPFRCFHVDHYARIAPGCQAYF